MPAGDFPLLPFPTDYSVTPPPGVSYITGTSYGVAPLTITGPTTYTTTVVGANANNVTFHPMPGYGNDVSVTGKIKASDVELDGVSMKEMMAKIEERLAILTPDPKKLAKYEALRDLYSQYKMMEALLNEDTDE